MAGQEEEIESTDTRSHLARPRSLGLFADLDSKKDLPLLIAPLSRFSIQKLLIAESHAPHPFSFRFPAPRSDQLSNKLCVNRNDERLASGFLTVPRLLPSAFRPKLYDASRDDSQSIFGKPPLHIDVNRLRKRKREQDQQHLEQQQLKQRRRQEQQEEQEQEQEGAIPSAQADQFPPSIVPVCPTLDQQSMCDALLKDGVNNNRSLENISRVFAILYHPASVTLTERSLPLQEQWKVSGKLTLIDAVLHRLESAQITNKKLAIITYDLDTESFLLELIRKGTRYKAQRLSTIDTDISGRGIIIQCDPDRPAPRDLIVTLAIAMDIRIRPGNSGISSCRTTSGLPAPRIWLVTTGSFEQRAANYISRHQSPENWNMALPTGEQAYRDLLKERNIWPSKDEAQKMQDHVLETVFDWLMQDPASDAAAYKYTSPKQADHTPIPSPSEENTRVLIPSHPSPSTSTTTTIPSPLSRATTDARLPSAEAETLTPAERGNTVYSQTNISSRHASVQTDPLADPVIVLDDLPITKSAKPPPGISERLQKQIRKLFRYAELPVSQLLPASLAPSRLLKDGEDNKVVVIDDDDDDEDNNDDDSFYSAASEDESGNDRPPGLARIPEEDYAKIRSDFDEEYAQTVRNMQERYQRDMQALQNKYEARVYAFYREP
ncbi:hypothetical protein BCR43DRAFT_485372 [Syncephalastrum racemosum]|uniref:Uncharacterized protein n=1 Tax=Syncephalastrum racemosum TaxID=13706 RepID=A0A1X2HM95_SYNRA|nr:hypothetical protein BCR43DRAFT_485372 [Syncephalastrum racemosum]